MWFSFRVPLPVCVCVCPYCACASVHVFYVCERACQEGSSIWKINNHITWEDQASSLELTADRIRDKSTVLKRESGSDTQLQTHRCRHHKILTFYTHSTLLLRSFFTPENRRWPPRKRWEVASLLQGQHDKADNHSQLMANHNYSDNKNCSPWEETNNTEKHWARWWIQTQDLLKGTVLTTVPVIREHSKQKTCYP